MVDLELEGKIDQLRGRIKETWGALTDDDVRRAEGNTDRLVGIIKEKTGQSQKDIEDRLRRLSRHDASD